MYVRVRVFTRSPSKAITGSCGVGGVPQRPQDTGDAGTVEHLLGKLWACGEAYPRARLCGLQVTDPEVDNIAKLFGAQEIHLESWPDAMVMELQELVLYQLGFGVALL